MSLLRIQAGEALRALIARIVLTPAGDTLEIRLYGDLAEVRRAQREPADQQKRHRLRGDGAVTVGGCGERI